MIRTFEDLECWQACKKLRLFIDKNQLKEGRDLVSNAVRLLNGYMNYLKKAGKDSSVHEDIPSFGNTPDPNNQ